MKRKSTFLPMLLTFLLMVGNLNAQGNDYSTPALKEGCRYYLKSADNGKYLGTNCLQTENTEEAFSFYVDIQTNTNPVTYKLRAGNGSTTRLDAAPNRIYMMPNDNRDNWVISPGLSDGQYTLRYRGYSTYVCTNVFNGTGLSTKGSASAANAQWYFIPANEEAQKARDLTIAVKETGDAVHGNLATFSAGYPVTVPTDYTAYTASLSEDKSTLTLNAISDNIIPANTGVILRGDASDAVAMAPSLTTSTATSALGASGDEEHTFTSADNIYLLGKQQNGQMGFMMMNPNAALTLGAHKAYLQLTDASNSPAAIKFEFGTSTDIKQVWSESDAQPSSIYDLSGRRINGQLKTGIYIKNGKKIIVK